MGLRGNIPALKHVFTAQKRAVRTLFGIPKVNKYCKGHTKPVFKDNHTLSIHNLCYYSVMMETFKTLKSELTNSIFALFKKSSISFGTENTAFFDSLMMNKAARKMNIVFLWFN